MDRPPMMDAAELPKNFCRRCGIGGGATKTGYERGREGGGRAGASALVGFRTHRARGQVALDDDLVRRICVKVRRDGRVVAHLLRQVECLTSVRQRPLAAEVLAHDRVVRLFYSLLARTHAHTQREFGG